jgi:hypothetical protein
MVEARRLVAAGHGPVTSGRPVSSHAGHAQSRRCRSGHGRHGVGPAAQAPTARHVAHGLLACAIGGRSLCWARLASSARRCPASAALLPTRPRSDPEIVSSIQKSSGPKGHTFLLLGSSCHAATGARLVPWRQPGLKSKGKVVELGARALQGCAARMQTKLI